jgi:hypothetical protein
MTIKKERFKNWQIESQTLNKQINIDIEFLPTLSWSTQLFHNRNAY